MKNIFVMQKKIAIIFDFDDTLAPDSTSGFLKQRGVDLQNFWDIRVASLIKTGWDPVPAYLYSMLLDSTSKSPIIKSDFIEWGESIEFYKSVKSLFGRLRKYVAEKKSDFDIEFYLISSGIGEILRSTSIAKNFTDIWACDFFYNEKEEIVFPKNIVSFTDKTRFIYQISKGIIGPESRKNPFAVNEKYLIEKLRIPFNQMIIVGDGYTDIPGFSLLKKYGGIAIGVYDKKKIDKWGRAWAFIQDERVSNLHSADYGKSSDLTNSLLMAIDSIIQKNIDS